MKNNNELSFYESEIRKLKKENFSLREKLDSCWRDIADGARDHAEYAIKIKEMSLEIKKLKDLICELTEEKKS